MRLEEWVDNLVDDLHIAETVRQRDAADTGERFTLDELLEEMGLTRADFETKEEAQ